MSTLSGTIQRLALDLTSHEDQLSSVTGSPVKIWQAGETLFQCGLFDGGVNAESIVTSVANLVTANLIIRRRDAKGTVLLIKTIDSFQVPTWTQWEGEESEHFVFDLSATDTNQLLPVNGVLAIYYVIKVNTTTSSFVAGQGYGTIENVGLSGILPAPPVTGPFVFNGLLTVAELTVTGTAIFEDSDFAAQNATFDGDLAVSGDGDFGGDLDVIGTVTGPIVDKGGQWFNVKAYGAVGDNVADDTTEVQAAADAVPATGGTLYLPKATGYKISTPIRIKSGTRVLGEGIAGRIIPVPHGSFTPINITPFGGNIWTVFVNTNHSAVTITDANITYENLAIGPINATNFAGFGITTRMAQNVQIINCTGQYMNEFAILVASKDTLVDRCTVKNTVIAAYDHWEGAINATVRDSKTEDCPHGVLFNAEASTGSAAFAASNLLIDGCTFLRSSDGAIYVAPLNADDGSTISGVKLINNTVDQDGDADPGIVVSSCSDVGILNNTIKNVGAANLIVVNAEDSDFPSDRFVISDNTFDSCAVTTNTYITALGTNGRISGNKAKSCTGATAIHVDSPTTLILPNDLSGTTFFLANATNLGVPTTPGVHLKATTTALELTGDLDVSGSLTGPNVVPGYIDSQILDAPGTFIFSDIPAGFKELEITITGRGSTLATNVAVLMRFNNDTGANYEWVEFNGVTQIAQTSLRVGVASAGSSAANQPGSLKITVPGYAGATYYKNSLSLNVYSPSAGTLVPLNEFGVWKDIDPITRIDVFTASGGFATGASAVLVTR